MVTETATKPSLTLKQRINAPPAKVYAAFTEPQTLARWFGPAGVERVEAETDPRVGGRYKIVGHMSNDTHEVGGTYREIVPNEKLVFTWAWKSTPERESLVTVTFKPDGAGTILTLLHERFFDDDARDRHQHGWTGAFVKLEKMFA
jgi:uncharacterized protein YndB with AHSA1/START domain